MVTTESDGRRTPPHMREESDDDASLIPSEAEVDAAVAAKDESQAKASGNGEQAQKTEGQRENEKMEVVKDLIQKRQAKVGDVELHPDISMLPWIMPI